MSRARGAALLAAAMLGACGGGGGGGEPPPPPARSTQPQGIVVGAGSASAPGGHRVVGGVLGGATETKNAQHSVKGGIQP